MGLRERYTVEGPGGLGDADLIALVLETGCSGRSARQIATDALDRFGGLEGLARVSVQTLASIHGLGPARAVRVHAACTLGRRSLASDAVPSQVCSVEDALQYFLPRMGSLEEEELHGLFLNRRNTVLSYRMLTRGNDAHTIVDPRQVYRDAVRVGAHALIVSHNHPSGDPAPSQADVDVTHRLATAGRMLGIDLLDHIIVAGPRHRSLREAGLLPPMSAQVTPFLAGQGS